MYFKNLARITTGSQALVELLIGGNVALLVVEYRLPSHMHGGNGKVAYIRYRRNFVYLIVYACAYTYEHQYNLLLGLAAKMVEERFRILVVDSVISLFRGDFTGRGELGDLQVSFTGSLQCLYSLRSYALLL
ncbi:putative DNA recombination and repair protein Rad51 [Rosa chinensis]|uniref:Putative DNA recombination and repair protein Rad51 n=1 Tax=Rosa chinensis TaxID=74649 RepID=A0A2P6QPH8_ROSCH|nr:putative DNA recombination and repair protein Rad51 [Rosa chinensis]